MRLAEAPLSSHAFTIKALPWMRVLGSSALCLHVLTFSFAFHLEQSSHAWRQLGRMSAFVHMCVRVHVSVCVLTGWLTRVMRVVIPLQRQLCNGWRTACRH